MEEQGPPGRPGPHGGHPSGADLPQCAGRAAHMGPSPDSPKPTAPERQVPQLGLGLPILQVRTEWGVQGGLPAACLRGLGPEHRPSVPDADSSPSLRLDPPPFRHQAGIAQTPAPRPLHCPPSSVCPDLLLVSAAPAPELTLTRGCCIQSRTGGLGAQRWGQQAPVPPLLATVQSPALAALLATPPLLQRVQGLRSGPRAAKATLGHQDPQNSPGLGHIKPGACCPLEARRQTAPKWRPSSPSPSQRSWVGAGVLPWAPKLPPSRHHETSPGQPPCPRRARHSHPHPLSAQQGPRAPRGPQGGLGSHSLGGAGEAQHS